MVRNIVVIGGNSHPELTEQVCNNLGIPPAKALLSKFSVGETRVEIGESVRGKDVFIIQSGGGKINDHLMELLITVSACKTASATRVTAVLPLFPYSRQSDIPYNKTGAPLSKSGHNRQPGSYTFDSRPQTPHLGPSGNEARGAVNGDGLHKRLGELQLNGTSNSPDKKTRFADNHVNGDQADPPRSNGNADYFTQEQRNGAKTPNSAIEPSKPPSFEPQRGYKQWVAQAGTLIADLLTCAGADHVITMDLHDPQYQGFFDIPVDNLYGRQLLKNYIKNHIPNYREAVIVSPDAGGAKRATAIADALGMPFALIHKVCPPAPEALTMKTGS
jgi:ribose-phosphate pyrophosphokinase